MRIEPRTRVNSAHRSPKTRRSALASGTGCLRPPSTRPASLPLSLSPPQRGRASLPSPSPAAPFLPEANHPSSLSLGADLYHLPSPAAGVPPFLHPSRPLPSSLSLRLTLCLRLSLCCSLCFPHHLQRRPSPSAASVASFHRKLPAGGYYRLRRPHRSCSGRSVPYPFSFSDGCDITLRCANGGIKVRDFSVLNITSDSLLLDLPLKCVRRVGIGRLFFGPNFVPMWHNFLLLRNCTGNHTGCSISTWLLDEWRFPAERWREREMGLAGRRERERARA